jgi:predicted transcriptional regulator
MKKLKTLNITFSTNDNFMEDLKSVLKEKKNSIDSNESISFDSIETFKKVMTSNNLKSLWRFQD